ncbi:MAG: hypothetical protein HFH73_11055 [Lachnospiraceae bacterium]|jgi:stage III sporulation protein AB|nr:hypothetical protein [Lachnospiraceae bacterium]
MLKAAGVVLVLLGCSGMGWYAVSKHSARIRMLAELEQALQYLYGEIEYSGCDMIELLDKLALRQGYFEGLWENMGDCLRSYDGRGFAYHWTREIHNVETIGCLKQTDLDLLCSVGENLGNMDRQTQLRTLEIFQARLREILVQARREFGEKAKVSSIVWITAGLFLTLVLI